MKYAAKLLVLLALLCSSDVIRAKAGLSTHPLLTTNQDHRPGSVVRFEHLTVQDGLSQNAGLAIFQDHRGFLWVGTQDGLNRYDGYSFTVFRHEEHRSSSISHNKILSIAEDRDGFLWVGTWGGGLNRFDPVTETFTIYRNIPGNMNSLSHDTVTSLLQDSSGALWAGTLDGLNLFDPATNGFDRFYNDAQDSNSLSSNVISFIFEDSRHQLWIGTGALGLPGAGLNRFDPASGKAIRFRHNDRDPTSLASDNLSAICEAPDGNFWIGTGGYHLSGNGLDLFNPRAGTAFHYLHDAEIGDTLSGNDIASLWQDARGTLWVGTWAHGLNRMDTASAGHFTHYRHDPYVSDSLSSDAIWSLFMDRSGILWIGTGNHGIDKLPADSGQFSLYRNIPGNTRSLGANSVGAFAEDRYGYIWVGTSGGGMDRLDPRHGTFEHYRHDPADPQSLSNDMVMSVYADADNIIWAGTLGGGLNRMTLATGEVTQYFHDPRRSNSLADDTVTVIVPDGIGGLWLGTYGGLSHYNAADGSFTNYVTNYVNNPPNPFPSNPFSLNPFLLSENKVISLFLDEAERVLWIGTWGGGLNKLDLTDPLHTSPQFAPFKTYRYSSDDPASLSEDSVWTIIKTSDGLLWLGTQSGLNSFNPQTETFRRYTEKDGMPHESIIGILGDEEENLWLTTGNGLAKFDRQNETFSTYGQADGLQSNEFNSNAYFRSQDGTLYIGGINGFNAFRPSEIHPNRVEPLVAITNLEVLNRRFVHDLSGQTPLQLSYQQNVLAFTFAALDFGMPLKNRYAYQLEGFDQDWIDADARRYVTYTNLPSGEYVFHVRAANSDGVWNKTGVSLPIVITPPIWQTWWFQGAAILVLIAAIGLGFQLRLSTIRAQKVDLERQVALRTSELQHQIEQREKAEQALAEKAAQEAVSLERTRLARELHDAVTQTLFSVSLIAEALPDIWNANQGEGHRRLHELRQLTRGALAEMRTLLVELRPSALVDIPLPNLLRQLCEALIGRARLPIKFHVDGSRTLPPDVQVALYRITQEALNNVVKHARATQVLVQLCLDEPDRVTLSIVDHGNGFDPALISADHMGLKIMAERAEAIGATLSIHSQPGEGTQIFVACPLPMLIQHEMPMRKDP